MTRTLLTLAIVLLLFGGASASDYWMTASSGFSIGLEGYAQNCNHAGVGRDMGGGSYLMLDGGYEKNAGADEEALSIGMVFGQVFSRYFTGMIGVSGLSLEEGQDEIDLGTSELDKKTGYVTFTLATTLFPWGNLTGPKSTGAEKLGLTAFLQIQPVAPGDKPRLWGGVMASVMFGKDNR